MSMIGRPCASAAFFDLDKTLIATASSMALRDDLLRAGILTRRDLAMGVLLHLPYLIAGADDGRMQRMAKSLGALARGWDAVRLEEVVTEAVTTSIPPVCYSGALDEIARHKAEGRAVVIASASVEEIVRPVAQVLGADHAIGSIAEIDQDGHYTGEVTHYDYAENKARACAELAAEMGWDLDECWAYSDSVTDLPLLEIVGHPVAVNPDKDLDSHAREHGWQILTFRRTERVKPRMRQVAVPVAGLLASVGLAAGLWWLLSRRRGR
ncbi:HAD-IB family hydrolase [Schaalia sp. 19OD2882]|uniref:HAD family hydrolase n=1 Tax=Schaalia sp. 19OD2882 TaxID=2794089 RepID=UPI001C1EF388|nr:HAD-IB family hydrolase [Schaalia sp. 19OD2882]QWW19718.1 HAD-IB family hydrolase [Schaalia sp. 19OD2882]